MRTTTILAILIVALGLMVCLPELARAAPMGTAFTYQGRLMDANVPADGLYDLQFALYDSNDPCDCNQIGNDVNLPDVNVIDGYFTAALDFNDASAFNGEGRWLEIVVRAGDSNEPNDFVTLSPRQKVTATPYALFAKSSGDAVDGHSLDAADGSPANALYVDTQGEVGIGTMNPLNKLQVWVNKNWDGIVLRRPGNTVLAKIGLELGEGGEDDSGYINVYSGG